MKIITKEYIQQHCDNYEIFLEAKPQELSGLMEFFKWEKDALDRILDGIEDDDEALALLWRIISYAMSQSSANFRD